MQSNPTINKEDNYLDYLKINLQSSNKQKYLQKVRVSLIQQFPQITQQQLQKKLEQYVDSYRTFMHTNSSLSDSRSVNIFDQCLTSVHSGLKADKNCKDILSILSKVFIQQIIQESLQIMNQQKEIEEIDIDVVEEALRRKNMKKDNYHNLKAVVQK